MKNTPLLALALMLVACGGGGDDEDTVDAGPVVIDADTSTPDAPPAASCTAETAYAAGPSATSGNYVCGDGSATCASFDPGASDNILVGGTLNADALPDFLQIELYNGFGVFDGGIATGTYDLTVTSEANYSSCGACIRILSDMNTSTFEGVDDYFQTAGTLTITAFTTGDASTPSTITGSISGLDLEHVTIDSSSYTSTPVGDCSTTVPDFSFTTDLTDYAAK